MINDKRAQLWRPLLNENLQSHNYAFMISLYMWLICVALLIFFTKINIS